MNNCLIKLTFISLLLMVVAGCSRLPFYGVQESNLPTEKNGVKQKKDRADGDVYIVKEGDTLSVIAHHFSITTRQLQSRNKIKNPHSLQVGTRLVISGRGLQVPESFLPDSRRFIWPVKNMDVASDFGARYGRHEGIDLRAPSGTHIHASADGVVHFVGRQGGYGKVIILEHANKIRTLYAHNDRNLVNKGQRVKQGEVIAYVGRTGKASGNHVHFEYLKSDRKLNPRHYVSINKAMRAASLN